MSYIRNKKRGFSLLELILAVAIFSLGSVALGTLIIDANLSTKLASERIDALYYAKEGIEAMRSIRDAGWGSLVANDGSWGIIVQDGSWVLDDGITGDPFALIDNKYTRVINISTMGPNSVKIVSTVSWDLTPAHQTSVSLTTLLYNWR